MIYHSIAHVITEPQAPKAFYFDSRAYKLKEHPIDDLPEDRELIWHGIYLAMEIPLAPKKEDTPG